MPCFGIINSPMAGFQCPAIMLLWNLFKTVQNVIWVPLKLNKMMLHMRCWVNCRVAFFFYFFSLCSFSVTFKEETSYSVGQRPLERDTWLLRSCCGVEPVALCIHLYTFLCPAATWSASRWWKSRFCARGADRSSKASTSCTPELRPSFTETWNATTSSSRGPRAQWR